MEDVRPLFKMPRRPKTIPLKVRVEVLERSEGRCELNFSKHCTGVGTEFHHIQKRSALGPHTAENILRSCWFCNQEVEARPKDAIDAGVSRPRWGVDGAWR